jgi:hypothetical protein
MSDFRSVDAEDTGSIEVCAYRGAVLIERRLCESADDAAAIVEAWEQNAGVECTVRDLSSEDSSSDFPDDQFEAPLSDDRRESS